MKLEDAGIARDVRDGTTLRTSATAAVGHDTSAATTATLNTLVRVADERGLTLDVMTIATRTKRLVTAGGDALALLVVTSAVAYPRA